MGRRGNPRATPTTALGVALQARRGEASLDEAAAASSIPKRTLAHLERGDNPPSLGTARLLAVWLGWSLDQVAAAALQPAPGAEPVASSSSGG